MSTVNSSSQYTYSNYENPDYATGGSSPPPVVNAREILAQRGDLPSPPSSGSYPGNTPTQISSIIAAQNAERESNAQQKIYEQNLSNPSLSYFRQATMRPVVPTQRTAPSISIAEQNFNDLLSSSQEHLANLGSNIPGAISGETSFHVSNPLDSNKITDLLPGVSSTRSPNRYTQEISPQTLAKVDALRAANNLPPLENIVNTVSYSSGTNQFRNDTAKTLESLQEAKNAGLSSLDIFDQSGKKIGTTNPQDITKARYDILNASLSSGGPVTAKGSFTTNTVTSILGPDYYRQNDNPLKSALASVVEPGAYIGLSLAAPLANLFKTPVLGVKPGATEQDVQTQIEKSIGPTYLDKILQGNFNPENMTLQEKAASILGTGLGLYLSGGGGGRQSISKVGTYLRNIPSLVSDLSKGTYDNTGIVSKIASGLKEDNIIQNIGPRELVTGQLEKGSPIREITQGTIGKSGIESFTPEKAQGFIDKLPSGEVQATGPAPLPKGISETNDIVGIGEKGQPKVFTQATEIKLEPGLEGQTKNPYALINPKGATAIVRSEPQDILPPDKFLVEFQGATPLESAGQAVHYGLEEVPGMKNVYMGSTSSNMADKILGTNTHTADKILEGINSGKLKVGTDIFQFGSKEFARHPDIYGEVTRNPELYQSKAFRSGGAFESVTRPNVLRYLIGKGSEEVKAAKIGKNQLIRGKGFRPISGGDFGIGDIINNKIGAGAAGRAVNLLKNTENLAKNFGNVKVQSPTTTKTDYLGLSSSTQERSGHNRSRYETEYETLVYPKVLDVSPLSTTRTNTGQRAVLLSNFGLDQVNKMIQQGSASSLLNRMKISTFTNTRTGDRVNIVEIPKLDVGTGLITDQNTKQITTQINIPVNIPKSKEEPGLKLGGGFDFNLWGYPSGRKKRRVERFAPSFFVYSVNPNVVGAIAEAGTPGKLVSTKPISYKGFGKVKGPNLGKIGKGILSGNGGFSGKRGRGKGRRFNLDNFDIDNIKLDLNF